MNPNLNARRKADREAIAAAMVEIAEHYGAKVERTNSPRHVGWCGPSIDLSFALNGVGATISIDDLHGGERSIISWYNSSYARPVRNFDWRFQHAVGDPSWVQRRRHHKATSGGNWQELAERLRAGLVRAMGEIAFEEIADAAA